MSWLTRSLKPDATTPPPLAIEWGECRNAKGELFKDGAAIGEQIRAHAWKHRLPVWQVFRDSVVSAFTAGALSEKELISIAAACSPAINPGDVAAITVLYFALDLNRENARKRIFEIYHEAGFGLEDKFSRLSFRDAEVHLGLPSGTLHDPAWGSPYPDV